MRHFSISSKNIPTGRQEGKKRVMIKDENKRFTLYYLIIHNDANKLLINEVSKHLGDP